MLKKILHILTFLMVKKFKMKKILMVDVDVEKYYFFQKVNLSKIFIAKNIFEQSQQQRETKKERLSWKELSSEMWKEGRTEDWWSQPMIVNMRCSSWLLFLVRNCRNEKRNLRFLTPPFECKKEKEPASVNKIKNLCYQIAPTRGKILYNFFEKDLSVFPPSNFYV